MRNLSEDFSIGEKLNTKTQKYKNTFFPHALLMEIPEKFTNKAIYRKAKADIDKSFKAKGGAYKSLALIKRYKDMGGKINERKSKGGLSKWLKEDWRNLTPYAEGSVKSLKESPKCGSKGKNQKGPSVCRPLKKMDSKTVSLATEYSKAQIKKAVQIKKRGETIQWKNL